MRDDKITVGAVAIIAMCVATAAHEAMGHGTACLLLGGRITLLTSVYFHCAVQSRFVSPAGPLGNLLAAVAGWAAMRLLPTSHPRAKLFALLLMAFSLFWAFGYLVSSLVTGNGDYAIAMRDFLGKTEETSRICGIVAGAVLYLLFSGHFGAESTRLLGTRAARVSRAAWLAATVAAIVAAALYRPGRGDAMFQAGLEIGAASIPLLIPRRGNGAGELPPIARSMAWLAVAVILFAGFALTLGAGYTS
jgi:hypothetical protein